MMPLRQTVVCFFPQKQCHSAQTFILGPRFCSELIVLELGEGCNNSFLLLITRQNDFWFSVFCILNGTSFFFLFSCSVQVREIWACSIKSEPAPILWLEYKSLYSGSLRNIAYFETERVSGQNIIENLRWCLWNHAHLSWSHYVLPWVPG